MARLVDRIGLVCILAAVLLPASSLAGEPGWRAERRRAAEEARDVQRDVGRQFTLLRQSVDGALLDCKGKVSLWQVSVSMGAGAPSLPGGGRHDVAACLDDVHARLVHGVDDLMRIVPVGHPAAAALYDYRAVVLAVIGDFMPRRFGDRYEDGTDYDRRWQRMRDAIGDKAVAIESTLEAFHP